MKAGYSAATGAAVALVATTAKTILSVIAPAQFGIDVLKIALGFDGVTASDKAVLVELVGYTADGTGTAGTVNQVYGRSITTGFTSKYNYSVEPTGPTVLDHWTLTPQGGTVILPLGPNTPDWQVSGLVGVRLTAPTSAVNARGTIWVERC